MARVRAPELVGSGGWIGTDRDLSLSALRGKVVVLVFWTHGQVESHRMLRELEPLAARHPDELAVVAVHSPKSAQEAEHRSVVHAVARLTVPFPVLDDPELVSWQQYGVRGWPTMVVVDPQGYVFGGLAGTGSEGLATRIVQDLIDQHEARGSLRRNPLPLDPPRAPAGVLAFPGKVVTDRRGRIAIADTGHDRIIIAELGAIDEAHGVRLARITHLVSGLSRPQGVRLHENELLVCDTGNDRVGRLDLDRPRDGRDWENDDGSGIVRLRFRHDDVLSYDLSAPWDMIADIDGSYVIACAGDHRLYRISLDGGEPGVVAGTGDEGLLDGRAGKADLAQPSGLTRLANAVVFADAETSSIRLLSNDGRLGTLVGSGLFDWGFRDGKRRRALLQHPTGVAATPRGDAIYIADTFNSAIRVWHDDRLQTVVDEHLDEPMGLDVLADYTLVVADTNHHRIVVVDPVSLEIWPVAFEHVKVDSPEPFPRIGEPIEARNGEAMDLPFAVELEGLYPDPTLDAPIHISVTADPTWLLDAGPLDWEHTLPDGELALVAGSVGRGTVTVRVTAESCGDGIRTIRRSEVRHPIHVR